MDEIPNLPKVSGSFATNLSRDGFSLTVLRSLLPPRYIRSNLDHSHTTLQPGSHLLNLGESQHILSNEVQPGFSWVGNSSWLISTDWFVSHGGLYLQNTPYWEFHGSLISSNFFWSLLGAESKNLVFMLNFTSHRVYACVTDLFCSPPPYR